MSLGEEYRNEMLANSALYDEKEEDVKDCSNYEQRKERE